MFLFIRILNLKCELGIYLRCSCFKFFSLFVSFPFTSVEFRASVFFLKNSFRFVAKLGGRYRDFPKLTLHVQVHSLSHYEVLHQYRTYVTIGELRLTHNHHPRSILDLRAISWCCALIFMSSLKTIHNK